MKIYVNNSRSVTLCALEVESNTTAECVQNKIQEKLEIPSEKQRLFFTDKVLDVEKTLGGYEICNGSSIKLEFTSSTTDEATTYGEGLKITDKRTLKWLGSFESLKYLIEKLQLPKAKWMTPGGGSKLYECEEFSVRWYSTNGTLTFKGNKASEIKANFISILENEVEEISQSQDELQYNLLINDLMSKFMQRIDDKVEGISQEVNNLKANTSQPERIDLINNLKREIDELKNESLELRQRNATISYAMADLQTKVKDTENEKTSLITAIKLVQLDQSKPSGTKNQVDTWHVVRNKKPNVSKDAHKTAADISDVNRYEVLSDSDVELTEGQRPPYVRPITTHKNPGKKSINF
ncbi:ubiquitin [Paramuricea clavata]|uniref:Ubiquitin n=1 Tax=Paramuricea clavata TaxID=317549 RepID=A0A7D9JH95_PARCT|nr:ubiquitin [Paramuricea clavata]